MYAQGFPNFGPERRGAPVLSFNRVAVDGSRIRNRAGITNPDIVVVLDPSLVEVAGVTDGLKEGGLLVVNTHKSIDDFSQEFIRKYKVATVDAGKIAREELGVEIVNTTMIGALLKASGVVELDNVWSPLENRFGRLTEKNANALKRAYQETAVKEKAK